MYENPRIYGIHSLIHMQYSKLDKPYAVKIRDQHNLLNLCTLHEGIPAHTGKQRHV